MDDKSLKESELARFTRNLENFAITQKKRCTTASGDILESQIVTLQICGVITRQGAIKLHERVAEVIRAKRDAP